MIKNNVFENKKVLVTGHTGFKGSWLSTWLSTLGARVYGFSNEVPTKPSNYELIKDVFEGDVRGDVRDFDELFNYTKKIKPDFVFHLAAQPIVLDSYNDPVKTISTNVMGVTNIMEALRVLNNKCSCIIITSDKCYDNVEWNYGYREIDSLGGKDPYSGSKGAAELIVKSYYHSFFKNKDSNVRICVGRAGNVIGGGDWSDYRIVPDCINAWINNDKLEIRNPNSTRPWQHVLEPLGGYIKLVKNLSNNLELNGEAFNFGPSNIENRTVGDVVNELKKFWPNSKQVNLANNDKFPHEAGLLKLNCEKALKFLDWTASLDFKETTKWTGEWFYSYYNKPLKETTKLTFNQIEKFNNIIFKN
jgi:CDP-glucose 4,6-dehydratase